MARNFLSGKVFIPFLILILSCTPTAKLYRKDEKGKYLTGDLTEIGYTSIKQILAFYTKSTLKDTLIIRYDFNHEECWSMLDSQDDSYIQGVVSSRQKQIRIAEAIRQGISVFSFREEGNDINKLKKWDQTILIDSSHKLYNLLFYDRSVCGNSIIILPDKKFVLIRSDSHFDALNYTKERISQILSQ